MRHLLHDLREHLGGIILAALAAAFIGRLLPAGHPADAFLMDTAHALQFGIGALVRSSSREIRGGDDRS